MGSKEVGYEEILKQLEEKAKKEATVIDRKAGPLVLSLSDADLYQIRMICSRNIEHIERMTKENYSTLAKVLRDGNCKYHQLVWKVNGVFKPLSLIKGYNDLLKDYPVLRTNYIVDKISTDVLVTYEPTDSTFPIIDISRLDLNEQAHRIVSIAAAESRREYDPEKSSILRIQVLIMSDEQLAVIVSFMPQFTLQIDRGLLMRYIFKNMVIEKDRYSLFSTTANSINNALRKKNREFWNNQLKNIGKELLVPGEKKISHKRNIKLNNSIYKKIDSELYEKLSIYCEQNNIQKKTFILYIWGIILGGFNNENKISMALVGNQFEPELYPIFINRTDSQELTLHKIDKQWGNAKEYGYLEEEDNEKVFTSDIYSHFHIQHHFIDVSEMIDNGEIMLLAGNASNGRIGLTVNYDIFKNECRMNYIYYSDCFMENAVEQLHALFMHFLKNALAGSSEIFDKNKFISDNETEDERRRKISVVQRAISIKDTHLFELCSTKELIDISEKSIQQNCVVDDEILSVGTSTDYVGIVAEGAIEESIMDKGGCAKSMRILSKGSIFGIEALFEDNTATNTYIVATENATIVWLSRDELIKQLNKKPDMWRGFLEKEHRITSKLQRIWSLE